MRPMVSTATMMRASDCGGAVLELVPDELAEARVLRQHLGRDQHHPADAERQAQAGEDQRQRRGQHELGDLRPASRAAARGRR